MERIIKSVTAAFFLSLVITVNTQTAYANEVNYVKVGVGASSSSIGFKGDNINVFFLLDSTFISAGSIGSGSNFTISADSYYYVPSGNFYNNYSSALAEANQFSAQGYFSLPALSESGTWSVYYGPVSSKSDAQMMIQAGVGTAIIEPNGKRLILNNGSNRVALFENDQFTPYFSDTLNNTITVNSNEYRGYLNAFRNGASLTPVNTLNMEEYLYSSVASEMPSSWHEEALKSQAVASRCYAYSKLGAHSANGYDLCSSDHCQIYLGLKQEKENATNAVKATSGLVAYYGDELINATFFSSSGGITDDSENVWVNALPYLRAVSDSYDTSGKEWSRTFTLAEITNLASLNNYNIGSVTGVEITKTSSGGRVQELTIKGTTGNKALTKEEIRTFFSKSTGGSLESRYFRIGQFSVSIAAGTASVNTSTAPVSANSNLYVKSENQSKLTNAETISVINSTGNNISVVYYDKVNIQTSAGQYVLPVSSGGGIAPITSSTGGTAIVSGGLSSNGNSVTFSGRGWGHGIGLSQHGAKGMAEAGFTFEQIIKHYYTGVQISKVKRKVV